MCLSKTCRFWLSVTVCLWVCVCLCMCLSLSGEWPSQCSVWGSAGSCMCVFNWNCVCVCDCRVQQQLRVLSLETCPQERGCRSAPFLRASFRYTHMQMLHSQYMKFKKINKIQLDCLLHSVYYCLLFTMDGQVDYTELWEYASIKFLRLYTQLLTDNVCVRVSEWHNNISLKIFK